MSDNTTPAAPKVAYTILEFCAAYSLSPATVYRMLDRGELRAVKPGGRTLILRKDAQFWHNALPTWQPSTGQNRRNKRMAAA